MSLRRDLRKGKVVLTVLALWSDHRGRGAAKFLVDETLSVARSDSNIDRIVGHAINRTLFEEKYDPHGFVASPRRWLVPKLLVPMTLDLAAERERNSEGQASDSNHGARDGIPVAHTPPQSPGPPTTIEDSQGKHDTRPGSDGRMGVDRQA